LGGARAARPAPPLLGDDLTEVRRAVLAELRRVIARERSWLSHQYRCECAVVGCIEPKANAAHCPACGEGTTHWRYEDAAGEVEPRRLVICHRCGIIADTPAPPVLEVRFSPPDEVRGPVYRERFIIRNLRSEAMAVSVAAQFNEWELAGIVAHPPLHELILDAGASEQVVVDFTWPEALPPDIVSLHCYAMSERCELSAFTRKVVRAQAAAGSRSTARLA
jgi:hypothetical protein